MIFDLPSALSRTALRGLVGMFCLGAGLAIFGTGRTCQASCGDYVVLRGSHTRMGGDLALDFTKGTSSPRNAPAPRKLPCNSPACRGEVPQPPLPQSPLMVSQSEKPLALFASVLNPAAGELGGNWPQSSEHARPGFRSLLERPPML